MIRWVNPSTTVNGNPVTSLSSVKIWRNETLVAESDQVSIGDTLELTDVVERPDYYRYRICVIDDNDFSGRILSTPIGLFGGEIEGIIVWELDLNPVSGQAIESVVNNIDYDKYVYVTNASGKYELNENIDAVFVCLGVYSDNHVLSEAEGNILKDYLDNGGNIYMEGGDTWAYDNPSPVHPYFHITGVADGTGDLSTVSGVEGTDFAGVELAYAGANSWIDHLGDASGAELILENRSPEYGVGVSYNSGTYKTIGISFQFGGLTDGEGDNNKRELLTRILNYFGFNITGIDDNGNNIPDNFTLNQNYPNPFNPSTNISYNLKTAADVNLIIYNSLGQKIKELVSQHQPAGKYEIKWDGKNNSGMLMPSGIYFIRLEAGSFVKTRRMLLLR